MNILWGDSAMEEGKTYQLRDGKDLVIRRGIIEDAEAMLAYVETIAGESDYITFGPGEFNVTVEEERKTIEDMAGSSNQLFIVAEIDGKIVGNLVFRAGKRIRIAHTGEFGISILKEYWNGGIGRRMIEYMLEWAKASGQIRKINLRVRSDNQRGIALYKKMGFREEGLITRDFYINGVFYDSFTMGICIDSY